MKQRKNLYTFAATALILASVGLSQAPRAALLNLSDAPLVLGSPAEPNIFLLIDDSGSMDFEVVTRDFSNNQLFTGTQRDGSNPAGAGSITDRSNCTINKGTFTGYVYGVEFNDNTYNDDNKACNTAADAAWRFRNSDYNPLYFNPNATYTPWVGVNRLGQPYTDIDIRNAPENPYLPVGGNEDIDLTADGGRWTGGNSHEASADGFRYYEWNDDGDGVFENGEAVEHRIKDEDAATQQSFANWFSYYRKREYVAKAAYGQLIAQAQNVRIGMGTLHNHNNVKTEIKHMEVAMSAPNKSELLDNLYDINSNYGTPLRASLNEAGQYLECVGNNFFPGCPALPADEGGTCQQNFTLLMTDGFYNSPSFNTPGSPDNKDGNNNSPWDGGAYADSRDNTLADVAMHYYERDLQPGLADNVVPLPGIDEARHQHMVTYAVAFGVEGSLTAMPTDNVAPFSWPDPFAGTTFQRNTARVDDVRHAAYDGRGRFLSAKEPQELIDALNTAFADIGDRIGAAASVAANSAKLQTDTHLYQGRFNSFDWSGQLRALPVGLDAGIGIAAWDAGEIIDTQDYDAGREIITYSTDPSVRDGVPFRWVASPPPGTTTGISAPQQALLNINPNTLADDGDGQDRLKFLRGDTTFEDVKYRRRGSALGDIVHSAPSFVGAPQFFYPDTLETVPYSSFVLANKNRTPVVYVGANDGMLHGFNADNASPNAGQELIAYVPSSVYPNLSKLTGVPYKHRYFVDGSVFEADAFISGAWMSVLIGALGGGGQGIFALDVTNPGLFTEGNADNLVLWEFTDADDPDLGYTYGEPRVVKMANGQWAVIFGNGYNSSKADGNASTTGHAVLYIVFIQGGIDGSWDTGDVIKLDTLAGSPGTPNGLASAAPVDFNNDEITDYIFAGDLEGNLWKFDVTNPNPAAWKVAYGGGTPQPLFTAVDSGGTGQPITMRPDVALHPVGLGFLVNVGTGKYLEDSDNLSVGQQTQTFYGIWDKNEATLLPFTRSHLLQQKILLEVDASFDTDGDGTPDTTETVRTVSDNPINWHMDTGNPTGTPPTTHLGWYMDLVNCDVAADGTTCTNTNNLGERPVTTPTIRTGRLIFETLIPSTDPCAFGGEGFLMEIDFRTGGQLAFSPFDLNNDLFFNSDDYVQVTYDVNGDGVVDTNDRVIASGIKQEAIPSAPVVVAGANPGDAEVKLLGLSNGTVKPVRNNPGPGEEGRQSWRQLQ